VTSTINTSRRLLLTKLIPTYQTTKWRIDGWL